MRLLFDQNISFRVVKKLKTVFPECKHVSDMGLNNCDDQEIWLFAHLNNYIIVTFDSDFFDISLINGTPPKIIWLRKGNLNTTEIADLLFANKSVIFDFVNDDNYKHINCLEII